MLFSFSFRYTKALTAKKEREKSKASSGPKGPKYHVTTSQVN